MHNYKVTKEIRTPAYATDVEGSTAVIVVPFDGVIESVQWIPDAAIAGAATNHRKHELVNKGAAGVGTAVPAVLAYDNGVNGVAFDAKTVPLSATAADLAVVAGNVLAWSSTAPGTGLADPGGLLRVVIRRNNT